MKRLSLRARLTLAFAAGMTLVSVAVASFVYTQVRGDLRAEVDMGLRARAQALIAGNSFAHGLASSSGHLSDNDESFAQLLNRDGRMLESTRSVSHQPLLDRSALHHSGPWFHDRTPSGLEPARLLVVPVTVGGNAAYLVVGATLSDTREALSRLLVLFAIALPAALAVSSLIGWLLAGAALRPVRRMSAEAASITAADPARRLAVPDGDAGLVLLTNTVNSTFDRLQAAITRERSFVANASHELRTPLTILKAEVDSALAVSRTTQELRAALDSAATEINHLIAIAEGLLLIARAGEGRIPIDRSPTRLGDLIDQRLETYAGKAAARGVQVVSHTDPVTVALDRTRVRQTLDILLDNAIRHSPAGGVVTVGATAHGDLVSIEVTDTGPGFSETAMETVFQPFNRGADGGAGAGLGLALAHSIARAHGGDVTVRNQPDGGAEVTLTLHAPASSLADPAVGEPLEHALSELPS